MSTAWSHLPNAVHIDRVLTSATAYPDYWNEAYEAALLVQGYGAAYGMTWDVARSAAYYVAYYAARAAAERALGAPGYVARGAIMALIVYDDCAKYLDMPSDQLRVWATLSEKPAAILMLPAVIAFEKISELELVYD